MAVTYDPTLATDKDWVRFLVGDRSLTAAALQDEEILAVLAQEPNKYLAAAWCAESILGKHGDQIMKQVGDLRIEYNDSPQSAYRQYIQTLRERGARDMLTVSRRAFRVL